MLAMKIVYSGGTNSALTPDDSTYNKYGLGGYFIRKLKNDIGAVDQSSIAVVVASNENKDHFNELLTDCGLDVNKINILSRGDSPKWGEYQIIFLLGGTTKMLYDWLKATDFSLGRLKSCKLLAGASAGAYVLGAKTMIDYNPDGTDLIVDDGFYSGSNILVAAHVNNTYYHQDGLTRVIEEYCAAHNLELLMLEENQLYTQQYELPA